MKYSQLNWNTSLSDLKCNENKSYVNRFRILFFSEGFERERELYLLYVQKRKGEKKSGT